MTKMNDDIYEERHPFEKRGNDIKRALYLLTLEGPCSWEAIFAAGRAMGLRDSTIRNAVNEGVSLGVFEKSGGKAGRKAGRPIGPPMVHLTDVGARWFPIHLPATYESTTPCDTCGDTPTRLTKYGNECQRCDEIPDEDENDEFQNGEGGSVEPPPPPNQHPPIE